MAAPAHLFALQRGFHFDESASMRARVLSGMRPTGAMHLGHYHGA
jgi:hypothetical protein